MVDEPKAQASAQGLAEMVKVDIDQLENELNEKAKHLSVPELMTIGKPIDNIAALAKAASAGKDVHSVLEQRRFFLNAWSTRTGPTLTRKHY